MGAANTTASAGAGSGVVEQGLEVTLPLALAEAVDRYLLTRPQLDTSHLLQAALAQFLVQQGGARPEVRELYLDGLFSTGL
ncbi:MAG: DUF2811 domain-containing protein [Vulcanococcus sp.]